jgi:hypothetical protein
MYRVGVNGQERERGRVVVQCFGHHLNAWKYGPTSKSALLVNPIHGNCRTRINNEDARLTLDPFFCRNGIEEPVDAHAVRFFHLDLLYRQPVSVLNQGDSVASLPHPVHDSLNPLRMNARYGPL